MRALLEHYRGALLRDCLGAYNFFRACRHFFCNAHLQRELVYIHEQIGQQRAGEMIDLLLKAKRLREREDARSPNQRRVIGPMTRERIQMSYCDIVLRGLDINPESPPPPGKKKRGRVKRSNPWACLRRWPSLSNHPNHSAPGLPRAMAPEQLRPWAVCQFGSSSDRE